METLKLSSWALEAFIEMDLFWVFLGLGMGVVVHEAGHALVGAAVGIQIHMVSLGEGREILRLRFRETWVKVGLLLWSGEVIPYPAPTHHKYRDMLFILGGVLGNAMLAGVIVLLLSYDAPPPELHRAAGLIGTVQIYLIAVSLVPRRSTVVDASLLVNAFKTPHGTLSPQTRAYSDMLRPYCEGREPHPVNSPAELRVCYHLSRRSAAHLDLDDVYAALEREWARGGLAPELEMHVLDSLLTRALISDRPVRPQKMDEWSKRALELGPAILTLQGSRACVLIELGCVREGKTMLESILEFPGKGSHFDILMCRIFLAKAEFLLGHAEKAANWLAKAWDAAKPYETSWPDLWAFIARVESLERAPRIGSHFSEKSSAETES